MPRSARILCVQLQGPDGIVGGSLPIAVVGKAFIWAAGDPDAMLVPRKFRICRTGHEVDDVFSATMNYKDDVSYVGTFQQAGGTLVWHVFDLGEAS
jgi:hypothetical protein